MSRFGKRGGEVVLLQVGHCLPRKMLTSLEALAGSVTHDAITIRLIVLYHPPMALMGTDSFIDHVWTTTYCWELQHSLGLQ